MLNYAIIGFGGLGKLHFSLRDQLRALADVELVALCDVEPDAFTKHTDTNLGADQTSLELSAYRLYHHAEELFDKEQLDFVITALPTYIHEQVAVMAMDRGIHVFSEKPMAITLGQCQNMLAAARANGVRLMVGHCIRFWPAYVLLKEWIDTGRYGKVVRADFMRFSSTPRWSWQNWMMDEEKSGAVILDLHIHDVDYVNWVFGLPVSVTSFATNDITPHDSIQSVFRYADDKLVTIRADWGFPDGYPFAANFTVRFEKATVELRNGGLYLYAGDGKEVLVDVPAGDAYLKEEAAFVQSILDGRDSDVNPPASSLDSIRLALAERESADTRQTVMIKA